MMTIRLSPVQKAIHTRALEVSREYRRLEWLMVECLQEVDRTRLYKRLGFTSLFQYTLDALKLTESVAYCFIGIARKAAKVPELKQAIQEQKISVPKASRMVSVLTCENSSELIEFAANHSTRKLDFEVARRNPRAAKRNRAKPLNADRVELTIGVAKTLYEKLTRVQDLASRSGDAKDLEGTLEVLVDEYLRRHDPVQKAERASKRRGKRRARGFASETPKSAPDKSAKSHEKLRADRASIEPTREAAESINSAGSAKPLCSRKVQSRIPLTAQEKHAVVKRDGDQCTFRDAQGERCTNRRWLHVHHVRPLSQGGNNELKNLTTLCSSHHDLVHQLGFPIEGQISWIKEPRREYLM